VSRMARLGEFAPFGRLFTLGRFSKIYIRSNTNFWATVFHSKRYVLIRQYTVWSIFFTNASCHPVIKVKGILVRLCQCYTYVFSA
jgi:hypothetical protein